MPSPELKGYRPEQPTPPPEQPVTKFSFLKKPSERVDSDLQGFDADKSRREVMRRLNILAGTERIPAKGPEADRTKREITKAERLLSEVADAIHWQLNRKDRMEDFAGPLARFQNLLINLLINLPPNEMQASIDRAYKKLQKVFSNKYPKDAPQFPRWYQGHDRGIITAAHFIRERRAEQPEPERTRRLFYNSDLDARYGIDMVELTYHDNNGEIVVEDMNLIQVKSSQGKVDEVQMVDNHRKFVEDFIASVAEYEKRYVPHVEFENDDEQLAFNESLAALQSEIEVAGALFVSGKMSKAEFVQKIVGVLNASKGKPERSDFTAFNELTATDKLWFVESYLTNLMQYILDPGIETNLKSVIALVRQEIAKVNYTPPKPTVINSIRSSVWAPGDPMPGSQANPGVSIYSAELEKSSKNVKNADKPIILRS